MTYLEHGLVGDQLPVDAVGLVEQRADGLHHLLALLVIFYSIHSAAGPRGQRVVEFRVFAETAGMAEERIFLVVVYGPKRNELSKCMANV